MLVYGDPQFESSLGRMLEELAGRALACNWENLDELRALLIQTGQLEQAVADCWEQKQLPVPREMQELTDAAARVFHAVYHGRKPEGRTAYGRLLQRLRPLEDSPLNLKTPAYVAFRVGLMSHMLHRAEDEAVRLQAAYNYYY